MPKSFMRGALTAIAVLPVFAFSGAASAADLNVGFVYVSPIGEAGWTYQHDLGRKEVEKNLGDKV
ncbi:MAG: BMP family ABC transporter substrate-binding protein, partial [Noviherbaspirillum sp.]